MRIDFSFVIYLDAYQFLLYTASDFVTTDIEGEGVVTLEVIQLVRKHEGGGGSSKSVRLRTTV